MARAVSGSMTCPQSQMIGRAPGVIRQLLFRNNEVNIVKQFGNVKGWTDFCGIRVRAGDWAVAFDFVTSGFRDFVPRAFGRRRQN
jgi:hypothetical protein